VINISETLAPCMLERYVSLLAIAGIKREGKLVKWLPCF